VARVNPTSRLACIFLSVAMQTMFPFPGASQGEQCLQTTLGSDGSVTVRFVPPEELADPPWDLELLAEHHFSLEKYGGLPYFPVRCIAIESPSRRVSVQIVEAHRRKIGGALAKAARGPQPDSKTEVLLSPRTNRLIPILAFPESSFPTSHVAVETPVASGKKVIARLKVHPFAGDAKGASLTFADVIVFRIVPLHEAPAKESWAMLPKNPPETKSETARPLIFNVPSEGIYSVSAEEIFAWWGSDPLVLNDLSLKCRGQDIAYDARGDGDELLEAGESLLFYGVGGDNIFTRHNAYWLAKGGQAVAMPLLNRPPPTGGAVTYLTREVRFERNVGRYEAQPPGTGNDHWFWERLTAPQTVDVEIELPNPADSPNFQVELTLGLQGATSTHATRVSINGDLQVEEEWEGLVPKVLRAEFPQSLLQEGTNTVTIEEATEGDNPDIVYLDWIRVRYDSRLVAEQGQLTFTVPVGVPGVIAAGFQEQDVLVFDVTQERTPCLVEGFKTTQANGGYQVEFGTMSDCERRYVILSDSTLNRPSSIRRRSDSTWSIEENRADWIVVTHSDFLDAARRLASHRESQGLKTAVVDVQDAYDELNYGIVSPEAVRELVRFAYENWRPPAPRYLLLFGDGHGDYMDWYGTHQPSFILPHYSWVPPLGWAPDDDWFGCVEGDDPLAEVYVGRLPVRSAAEAEAVVDKMITYDSSAVPQQWHKRVTFCAGAGSVFRAMCQSAAGAVPPNFQRLYLFRDDFADAAGLKEGILETLDAGSLLFFYFGHGNVERWSESFFHVSDVPSLSNGERLPVMCMLTCLSGYFAVPWKECLAEELVRTANGGVSACVAPTAANYPSEHLILAQGFARWFFAGATLGQCLAEAKLSCYSRGLSESFLRGFVLIGDPATSPQFVPPTRDLLWLY